MKIYLDMIGCRLNQSEIETMARQFVAAGHTLVGIPSEADLAVVNTCTVTAAAAADSRKVIRRIARSGVAEIIATGCWSSLNPGESLKLPGVIRVVSNAEKDRLVPLIIDDESILFDKEPMERAAIPGKRLRTRAFIKVQDGCSQHCTFCVTTVARGDSQTISAEKVILEVKSALRSGVKEVVFTGVQLGSWGKELNPQTELADLLYAVLKGTDIKRLRLSSIEPWDISDRLIDCLRDERIAPHFHLPLQSGSTAVLRRMARAITPKRYSDLVDRVRRVHPEIAITTDVMVGFPGETEEEFEESLDFIRKMKFAGGHVFSYSAREGTPAADFPEQVPHGSRKMRSAQLRKILDEDATEYRRRYLGKIGSVLWESIKESEGGPAKAFGLTKNYLRVEADAPPEVWNTISSVKLLSLTKTGFKGEIIQP